MRHAATAPSRPTVRRRPAPGLGIAALLVVALAWPAAALAAQGEDTALTAFRSGRYDEALQALRQRVRVAQAPAADHRLLSRVLMEVGRYEEAAEAARDFAASHPESAELFNALGEALLVTGQLDDAERAFERSVAGGATDQLTARLNLAVVAFDRGRRQEAMERFDTFIDVYNGGRAESAEDLTAVGIACRYLGIDDSVLFQDALRAFDEAVAADPGALQPRILSGELFLEKYDSQNAATDLANALQLNPRHPDALLAMARRLEFDGEPEAVTLVGQALEVNPNLVGAYVLRAHQLLKLERFDDAATAAEEALGVNPAALDALAALAAAHYLRNDVASFERVRERTLQLNPGYADLYNTLADLAVQNRLYDRAVEFAREATRIDPQSWRGHSIMGVNQLRVGDIEGGRASLETSFAGDPYNVWVKNTLDLLDTFPDYEESSSGRFDLMIERDEAGVLALYVGLLAEEAYDYFAERYRYAPPTPIRIEVYPSHADFSVRTVGLAGLGALGVSFGPVIAIDSPSARTLGEFNWGSTLWHEIAHTFTLGTTDFRIPRWFSEGLSVYEEHRARPSWGDDASVSFLIAYLRGELLPIASITDGFMRPKNGQQVVHSYYQASLVCELLERDWGFEAILGLLEAYRTGASTEEAFDDVLGVPLSEFDQRFSAYVADSFAGPLAALRPALDGPAGGANASMGAAPPSLGELQRDADTDPEDFLAQLAYGAALVGEDRVDDAVDYLERAKALFPSYAEANSPYWYLAMIYKQRGESRRAIEELDRLVAINEKHYAANLELAALNTDIGDPGAAATALERVVYIYPMEISMHEQLAELYDTIGEQELAVRERQAVVALAPVDMAEALYQLARAHHAAGDMAAAKRSVLGSLEIAPGYPAAQQLLLDLVGRQTEVRS